MSDKKFDRVEKPTNPKDVFSVRFDGKLIGWKQISQNRKIGE